MKACKARKKIKAQKARDFFKAQKKQTRISTLVNLLTINHFI